MGLGKWGFYLAAAPLVSGMAHGWYTSATGVPVVESTITWGASELFLGGVGIAGVSMLSFVFARGVVEGALYSSRDPYDGSSSDDTPSELSESSWKGFGYVIWGAGTLAGTAWAGLPQYIAGEMGYTLNIPSGLEWGYDLGKKLYTSLEDRMFDPGV